MSINPETDLDLDKLFLPAWAQEAPAANRFAHFRGDESSEREDRRRGGDRGGTRPPRREGAPRGEQNRGRRDDRPRGPGGPRPQGQEDRKFGGPRGGGFSGTRDGRRDAPTPTPLPEVNASICPTESSVDTLFRQIRMTGRSYPLFEIAKLILLKPDRFTVRFDVKKNAEGKPIQPLFMCALDDTLWFSEEEVVGHTLRRHFNTFYQTDRTPTDPPKGTYTFVAQCGMSGVILGPPNYHDYQNKLHKLHNDRFSRLPFDAFKARVKIVRDPEVVKQWVEEQSVKTEFTCLNVPEALKLPTREEVEKHFRATHLANILKPVESHTLSGEAARAPGTMELGRLVRQTLDSQRRFPLQLGMLMSQQFAGRGLQFFKVNKTITHVSVARPVFLDLETTPVSEGIRKIVEFINSHPKCTRRQLIEALAPTAKPPTPLDPAPAEAAPATPTTPPMEPTPEQNALIGDLHWLIHQGHIIEFGNGMMDTAKRPLPRPPKPEKKPVAAVATTPATPTDMPPTEAVTGAAAAAESPSAAAADGVVEPAMDSITTESEPTVLAVVATPDSEFPSEEENVAPTGAS